MKAHHRWCCTFLTMILAGAIASPARSAVWHVPADFPTIQTAIGAANNGDEIVVAAGTYNEAINLLGKQVTLRSDAGAAVTTLDGAGLDVSIITANTGETLATVVQGFTLLNGIGTDTAACALSGRLGGAIFLQNSALSVTGCVFKDMGVFTPGAKNEFSIVGGGAIHSCNSSVVLTSCEFDNTIAGFGGAVRFMSQFGAHQGTIQDCTFSDHISAHGGGVYAELRSAASLNLANCAFAESESSFGAGMKVFAKSTATVSISDCGFTNGVASFGGGLNLRSEEDASIAVWRCDFIDHEAGFGGGVFAEAEGFLPDVPGGRIDITNCRFLTNTAHNNCCNTGLYFSGCYQDGPGASGLVYGGGADVRTLYGGFVTLTNCLFAGNSGMRGGGAHAASCAGGLIEFVNCTIVNNDLNGLHTRIERSDHPKEPGIGEIRITNTIVRDNVGAQQIQVELFSPGVETTVAYSNVQGGFSGMGNIDAAPAYINPGAGDYRLAAGSAGIDAGNNTALDSVIATDLADEPRYQDDPSTADTGSGTAPIVDIGAFEFQPGLPCPADTDGSGSVDVDDLIAVILGWGPCPARGACPGDTDGSGEVDVDDLIAVILGWGPCP